MAHLTPSTHSIHITNVLPTPVQGEAGEIHLSAEVDGLDEANALIEKLQEQRAATNEGFDAQLNDLRAAANALAAQIRQGLSVE